MIEAILAALAGLLAGSFLNVCIYRLPRDLSVVRPRSFCPECEQTIAWHDNIPVVSFLLLRARCRHCRARIPVRYPLVELLTAASFAIAVASDGVTLAALKVCLLAAAMIALAFSDLECRILPDEFTLGGAAAGVLLAWFVPMEVGVATLFTEFYVGPRWASLAESLLGAVFVSATLWLVGWLYWKVRHREGLGMGDVKLVATVGAFFGLHQTLFVLLIASVAGSVLGLIYIWRAGKEAATYELPYGTFLAFTALLFALAR